MIKKAVIFGGLIAVLFNVVFAQDSLKAFGKSFPDSPDTATINITHKEEIPECLNLAEVTKKIVYPPDAMFDKTEGTVYIKLLVDTTGKISKLGEITGPKVFYGEVRRIAAGLLFKPGKVDDAQVNVWVTVPFRFALKK